MYKQYIFDIPDNLIIYAQCLEECIIKTYFVVVVVFKYYVVKKN